MRKPLPLIISFQYPSDVWEFCGIFIHRHVRALMDAGVASHLLSPFAYVPKLLSRSFAGQRRNQHMAASEYDGIVIDKVAFIHLPLPLIRHVSFVILGPKLARYIRKLPMEKKPNLIHVHRLYPEGVVGLVVARCLDLPIVCSARGSDVHNTPSISKCYMYLARKVIRNCDAVLAVSRKIADQLEDIAGSRDNITVIYNGIDHQLFCSSKDKKQERQQLNLPVSAKLILYVGRFEAEKGAFELLASFRSVQAKHADAKLIIVGANSFPDASSLLAGLQPDDIIFTGELSANIVAAYMKACDVFAFPSYAEGMPNALLEAMASGLPVVATPVGGVPEIIVDGENGFLVPVKDPLQLANRIDKVLSDSMLGEKMGNAAAASVKKQFSWEKNAQEHIDLYKSVLDQWQTKR